jgi:type I restriction enzyme R subunit
MLGVFPESINYSVIQSMGLHESMEMKAISNEAVAKEVAELMFDMLMKGLGKENITAPLKMVM